MTTVLERLGGVFQRMARKNGKDLRGEPSVSAAPINNELTAERYCQTLSEQDRIHVVGFVDFVRTLSDALPGVRVAVIAVGSTVRPESKRYHLPKDIDLRVLNSSPAESRQRSEIVSALQNEVRRHLQNSRVPFKEEKSTVEQRMVPGVSFDPETGKRREELVPFLDWYNNDPSFTINYPEGHPLHISISGVNNPDLGTYLEGEREHSGHFALIA